MPVDVWKAFKKHSDVVAELERYRGNSTLTTDAQTEEGGVFKGQVGGFNIWVYSAWYVDENGVEQAILPSGSVIYLAQKWLACGRMVRYAMTNQGIRPIRTSPNPG